MSPVPSDTLNAPPAPDSPGAPCLLTINGGSSSLKFALYDFDSSAAGSPRRILGGLIDRIGLPDARMSVQHAGRADNDTWNATAAQFLPPQPTCCLTGSCKTSAAS